MEEQAVVKSSILEVFRNCGYADAGRMTQRDFDHVGEEIEKKSGILISGTTIRRLANGEFARLPQIATLNAIANYFDYKTWQEYKASKVTRTQIAQSPVEARNRKRSVRYLYVIAAVVVLASIYLFGKRKAAVGNADRASFSFHKTASNDIPNSVVFNYNIDDVQGDTFFIQQSWDKNRKVRIYKNKYTITDIYYEPGFHVAKLIVNDSVIRTLDVSIPTDRWFYYAIDNVKLYTPEYIKGDASQHNGTLTLTEQQLRESNIDFTKDKLYHHLYFPTKPTVDANNFTVKTRVRTKELRNNLCPYIELELYCQRNYMILRSTTKGCANESFMQFGERHITGDANDLTSITFDVSQWTDIEMTVRNKKVTVRINGRDVFTSQYSTDAKLLAGFGFISNGLCEIDNLEITGLDGKVMYKNDF